MEQWRVTGDERREESREWLAIRGPCTAAGLYRAMSGGAGWRRRLRDFDCEFIFLFPIEANTTRLRKQLGVGTEIVQNQYYLYEKVRRPLRFATGEKCCPLIQAETGRLACRALTGGWRGSYHGCG